MTRLIDELLSIACASRPREMPERLNRFLRSEMEPREVIGKTAKQVVETLRMHARVMEKHPLLSLSEAEIRLFGLTDWIETTRALSARLSDQANEFEQNAVAVGLAMTDQPDTTGD